MNTNDWGLVLTIAGLVFAAGGTMWSHRDHERRLRILERRWNYVSRCLPALFTSCGMETPDAPED